LLRTQGIFWVGCRHFVSALGFALSNPAGCTIFQKIPVKKSQSGLCKSTCTPLFSFYIFRLFRTQGIFWVGCRHFVPALGFASSNPAGCTKLNIDLQEFITFADFLLYIVKYCKNQPIAVGITAFLRHDYGRTQMQYEL